MKKSIAEARERAVEYSEHAPDILIRVMDKRCERAVICSSLDVYRIRVLEGWRTVAAYRNGVEVNI